MELAPHLWRLFGLSRRAPVAVTFHAPRLADEFAYTRALTTRAEQHVAEGLQQVLRIGADAADAPDTVSPSQSVPALRQQVRHVRRQSVPGRRDADRIEMSPPRHATSGSRRTDGSRPD